jgi:uncharacterized membrane protein
MGGIISEARSNPAFVLLLAVAAVLALVVGVLAALRLRQPGGTILLAGAGFTLLAGIVTLVFNVPLNNRLNANDVSSLTPADAAREWRAYIEPWLVWNAVRCVAGLVGAALFAVGLWRSARGRETAAVG